MKQTPQEKRFAAGIPYTLDAHQRMLSDELRNKVLCEAITNVVSESTRFLDVGAGTGVWAILAALLGARRVVAVEKEECLIPIIFQTARENGVADKIEIIHADVDDLELQEEFDVIVSELFGYDVFGEKTVRSFINLRERYLAENGVLIPHKIQQFAVPVQLKNSSRQISGQLPLKNDFFRLLKLNYVQNYSSSQRAEIKVLAEPKPLLELDFREITNLPSLLNLSDSWKLEDISKANAFAYYCHSFYPGELKLDSFASGSWVVGIYEFQPFSVKQGEIRFEITLKKEQLHWKISLPSNPEIKTQVYSPGFGLTRIRMAHASTPHRKIP